MKRIMGVMLIAAIIALVSMAVYPALAEGAEMGGGGAIDLTGIMTAVMALISAIITCRVVPWIKARTTQTQRETISATVKTLVYAAEQLKKTGVIKDKYEYVWDKLNAKGITADRDDIESAVRKLCLRQSLSLSDCRRSNPSDSSATPAAMNAGILTICDEFKAEGVTTIDDEGNSYDTEDE